jgi:hypothetical protein
MDVVIHFNMGYYNKVRASSHGLSLSLLSRLAVGRFYHQTLVQLYTHIYVVRQHQLLCCHP